MHYQEWMETVAKVFEVAGVAVISIGALFAFVGATIRRPEGVTFFEEARRGFGRPFILGLEILIAADIIETIVVDRTLEAVAGLGILVLIRVVLSLALDVEMDGMFPWRRAELKARAPSPGAD